jgi:hypothetical protein
MKEVPLEVVVLPNGMLLCTGTAKMTVPSTDTHVRGTAIYLQAMELDPVATFSIVADQGDGTMFGIYSLKFGYVNDRTQTQVGIEAQNLKFGEHSNADIFCSYVIVGRPLGNN